MLVRTYSGVSHYAVMMMALMAIEFGVYETLIEKLQSPDQNWCKALFTILKEQVPGLKDYDDDPKAICVKKQELSTVDRLAAGLIAGFCAGFFTNALEVLTVNKQV